MSGPQSASMTVASAAPKRKTRRWLSASPVGFGKIRRELLTTITALLATKVPVGILFHILSLPTLTFGSITLAPSDGWKAGAKRFERPSWRLASHLTVYWILASNEEGRVMGLKDTRSSIPKKEGKKPRKKPRKPPIAQEKPAQDRTVSVAPDTGGKLKVIGGSESDPWNQAIANQVSQTLWLGHDEPGDGVEWGRDLIIGTAWRGLQGIAPTDEIEGMIAAQLMATHRAVME